MRHIHLIDTSSATDNVGDEIIVEAARSQLGPVIADAYITRSSGHDGLGASGRGLVATADVAFLLGTNALSARFRLGHSFMWRVGWRDLAALRNKVVLLGVGGNRDFDRVDWRQRRFMRHVLSRDHVHSVRDGVGARLVEAFGHRAVNTSCPTLWSGLGVERVPDGMAPRACLTLTRHRADPTDSVLLATLLRLYPDVWFWPQQPRDLGYLQTLDGHEKVRVIAPNLAAYDAFLRSGPVDVVGTRLHGTIRGLHHGRRALVVEIDNRARDIGAETGLPTITRADVLTGLEARLRGPIPPKLTLPEANIHRFLDQFRTTDSPRVKPALTPTQSAETSVGSGPYPAAPVTSEQTQR